MKEMLRAARKRKIPIDVPFARLNPDQRDFIMNGDGEWYGVKGFFDWLQTQEVQGPGPGLPQPLPQVRGLPGLPARPASTRRP